MLCEYETELRWFGKAELEEARSQHAVELRKYRVEPTESPVKPSLELGHVLLQRAQLLEARSADLANFQHHTFAAPEGSKNIGQAAVIANACKN